jgi:Tol biopolymer transport system component
MRRIRLAALGALAGGLIAACALAPSPSAIPGITQTSVIPMTAPALPTSIAATYMTSELTVTVPSGLVYRTSRGLWRAQADEVSQLLVPVSDAMISPDNQWALAQCGCAHAGSSYEIFNLKTGEIQATLVGATQPVWTSDSSKIYYVAVVGEGSDIWVFDLATGQGRNLSNTPDRTESLFGAAPAASGPLFFYSNPPGDPAKFVPGEGWIGRLAVMQADGTGYRVITQEDLSGAPAVSFAGEAAAYSTQAGSAWVYRQSEDAQRFLPAQYGLAEEVALASPAWSPDGRRIAWWTTRQEGGASLSGIGVYDLTAGTARLAGRFSASGSGGPPPAPRWSRDGKWIVFYGVQEGQTQPGLWLVNVANNQVRQLVGLSANSDTCSKVWSADGLRLAFACSDPALAPGIWLADLSTWQLYQTDVTIDASVVDWTELKP